MEKKPAPQSCVCASFLSPHSWRRLGGDVETLKRWLAYRRTCTGRSTAQSCRGMPAQHGLHFVTGSTLDQPERSPVCSLHPTHLEREREMFYLTTHSTHFIYGYMASDIWLRTILIVREETCSRHIRYSYRLTARVLLYAPSHRQDNTYHSLCYTSCGALAGTRNKLI